MARVSVVVPIFNGMSFLPAFFDSLDGALPPGSQVVLVDDGSTEPVRDTIPHLARASEVVWLRNEQNLGYSVAVNRGFEVATGEFVVQLNTDLVLEARCIAAMVELIGSERDVGLVGSKLVYPTTGRVQHVGMAFGHHSKSHVYKGLPADHPVCEVTREVQITTGATVAATRRVLDRLGPLDEGYFNDNEDIDHCLRARQHRLRNFVCVDSVAHHWESQSGPSRFARVATSEARFWETWAHRYTVDLPRYVDEALDHVLNLEPRLVDVPFDILDLSRGADQALVVDRLEARWPGIRKRIRSYRQMNNPSASLSLPLLLPYWVQRDPTPFIYLVDSHEDLNENRLWFQRRRDLVVDELIADLAAAVLRTSEVFPFQ